jgi:phospholipase C
MNPTNLFRAVRRLLAPSPSRAIEASFQKIEHLVVLMLENRSFDHLLGYLKQKNPAINGLSGAEFNYLDPVSPQSATRIKVGPVTASPMPFDPAHEFANVNAQLFGSEAAAVTKPPAMSGFVASALKASSDPATAKRVMECFKPEQLPVFSTLATEFAVFNYWYAPMPGPTFPNRFFVHAATSGGLTDSPSEWRIVKSFNFDNGVIFDRLNEQGKSWRIYYGDYLVQTQALAIASLRRQMLTSKFQKYAQFKADAQSGSLPAYSFIEPNYDVAHNFKGGNSMHPLNDVERGEALVKEVYEALRSSPLWPKSALVITFDEHGGFFDHAPPSEAIPTGDDSSYGSAEQVFAFDRYGVRVPTIFISPYTARGSVIDRDTNGSRLEFDHCAIPATLEKRFGLRPLTKRDAAALQAERTLAQAVNLATPRLSATAAPETLPMPPLARELDVAAITPPAGAPLTAAQRSFVALATACHAEVAPEKLEAAATRARSVREQRDVASYIREVESEVQQRKAVQGNP